MEQGVACPRREGDDPSPPAANEGGRRCDGHQAPHDRDQAMPGAGAAGAGLPFPQVASRQLTGPETGTSAICATWVTEVSAADTTPCGTKPPTTTAATIAARPIRHRVDMRPAYGCEIKAR